MLGTTLLCPVNEGNKSEESDDVTKVKFGKLWDSRIVGISQERDKKCQLAKKRVCWCQLVEKN